MIPTVIDLFAGAGGLSLGAARAGFRLAGAVELDPFAFHTHSRNFPNAVHLNTSVASLSGAELLLACGLRQGELDGLIGGPPCQGFSSMGRREIADERNDLFGHFFRLVAEIQPAFYVAENVPGILDPRYDSIRNAALQKLPASYISLPPIEVKADRYGAPTTRTRIFFIGFKPSRFKRDLLPTDFSPRQDVVEIFVKQALAGLPERIDCRWQTEEAGWRKAQKYFDGEFHEKINSYLPLNIGELESVERFFSKDEVSGCQGTRHSEEVKARYKALKHGEVDKISKSVRLRPDGFCPTLRAGTGKDKGSYQAVRPIHPSRARVITPREAARLQGFPDWFIFHSTKWHSFRQIGNSVSPIVAEYMLDKVCAQLV